MGKDTAAYPIEYAKQFFEVYSTKRKFFRLRMMSGESLIEEKLKYLDSLLSDFFKHMEQEGHLDNTIVHFYGIHGENVTPITVLTDSGA